jgi:hydrogenase/urease accessory protein HupE
MPRFLIAKKYFVSFILGMTVFLGANSLSQAHEIRPALLEFNLSSSQPDTLDLTLDMTAEIFLSGMDARQLSDTDESDKSAEYDSYRERDAAWLATEMQAQWPRLAEQIFIENGGAKLSLLLEKIEVEQEIDTAQIRQTKIRFKAAAIDILQPVTFSWAPSLGSLIVRQATGDSPSDRDTLYAVYLSPGERSDGVNLTGATQISFADIIYRYLHSGFVHIIPLGLDHILFVLGLFLFSLSGRVLFYQISLFTLAHTLTLALSSLGIVRISAQIVEPLIALSIAYVAIETIWAKGRFHLQRALLIIGFGLLHGMGFASVLADFGLPDAQFIPALISFNIGVEIGQLAIIAPLYILMRWLRPPARFYRMIVQIPASVVIASIGLYWTAERLGWWPI